MAPAPGTLPPPCLVYNKLPFSEDVRPWAFRSFANLPPERQPTPEQHKAAGDLIDAMTLRPDPATGRAIR
jgi:hypothetical protein